MSPILKICAARDCFRSSRSARATAPSTSTPGTDDATPSNARTAVFAPDYAPEEIAEIAAKLRKQAGLPSKPTGEVADGAGRRTPKRRTRTSSRARTKARAKT